MEFNKGSPKQNNPQKAPAKGMFASNSKAPPIDPDSRRRDEEISGITRRLKLLENSVNNLRNSNDNLEKNSIDQQKENRRDIKLLEEENTELKDTIRLLKNTLKKIADDMGNVARADEVKVIKKYLDLWNPVKFTTPEMVTRIVREEIDNGHNRQFDSRVNSIERDIYQKQELKDQIHQTETKDETKAPSLHEQFNPPQ